MTDSRWPILGIGADATEAEIRRAYAARLRAQGPDADVATFGALRAEFERALAALESHSTKQAGPSNDRAHSVTGNDRDDVSQASRAQQNGSTREPKRSEPASDETSRTERLRLAHDALDPPVGAQAVIDGIRRYLVAGDLVRACERYDWARAASEIGLEREPEIELELADSWLANTTLDAAMLAQIARRYRWDDAVTAFAPGPLIVAKLHANAARASRPGERFIGQWNWGAFALTPFWLMAHGRVRLGVRELLAGTIFLIVPLGFLAMAWFAIGYGKRGNAIAVRHRTFRDEAQFIAVQNAWRNWSLGLFIGAFACIVIAIAAIAAASR